MNDCEMHLSRERVNECVTGSVSCAKPGALPYRNQVYLRLL